MRKRILLVVILIVILVISLFVFKISPIRASGNFFHYPGETPYFLTLSHDGDEIYAAVSEGIAVIDKESMQILDLHPFQYSIYDMVLDTNGNYIYLVYNPPEANGTGKLAKMNMSDGSFSAIDMTPANVYCVAIDDAGEYLYVSGGTWPAFGEPIIAGEHAQHPDTGRIFEVRLSDFTLSRIANLSVALESGLSCQNGKLIVMSRLLTTRDMYNQEGKTIATTCNIIDINTLTIEDSIGVPMGDYNESIAINGNTFVLAGFNSDLEDGVGFGLINVLTNEVDQWFITDSNPHYPENNIEGGGFRMAEDAVNNIIYSLLYITKDYGLGVYRLGIIDLNIMEYTDWYIEPFRLYSDILYDPEGEKIYLSAPFDDAIVVLDPPEYIIPLVPPVACFTYYPISGPSPLMVTIDNCSYDEDGEIVRINCDWDADGEIDEVMEGNPDVLVHTFTEPGTTDFILTVVDNDELMATWIGTVDVG